MTAKNESEPAAAGFRPVFLYDLTPYQKLGFDVYLFLPTNGKMVHYIRADEVVDNEKLLRLRSRNIVRLYVTDAEHTLYEQYVNRSITSKLSSPELTVQQKTDIIRAEGKRLLEGMESIGSSEAWTNHCMDVTRNIIGPAAREDSGAFFDHLEGLLKSDGSGLADHSVVVAAISVLFGMLLGICEEKSLFELSLGGFLHDIGLVGMPERIINAHLRGQPLAPADREILREHPVRGVKKLEGMTKNKYISDNVIKIVLEHHENGFTGYPFATALVRVSPLAKIVAIAEFVSPRLVPGQSRELGIIINGMLKAQAELPAKEYDDKILRQLQSAMAEVE